MAECIHGLDEQLCDVCTPKAPPAPVARTVRVAQKRRADAPAKATALRARRHLVVRIADLASVLDGDVDGGEWVSHAPLTGFDSVVLVAPTDDVLLVTMIAVANEPARDRVRAVLAGREVPRIGVYPPWFTSAGWATDREGLS